LEEGIRETRRCGYITH